MSLAHASRSMNSAMDELQIASRYAQPRVFLSYARIDRDTVEALSARVAGEGYGIWWDKRIEPGEAFSERIREAIDEAMSVVVLWSEDSIKSPWVRWEASRGLKLGKLVPVAVPGLDFHDIRPPFNDLDTLRLDDESGLMAALKSARSRRS